MLDLRDTIAVAVLPHCITLCSYSKETALNTTELASRWAYEFADAMIEAREVTLEALADY